MELAPLEYEFPPLFGCSRGALLRYVAMQETSHLGCVPAVFFGYHHDNATLGGWPGTTQS